MKVAFKGIRKSFGATLALDDVEGSFDGKVCMLLGPNGSGKTTLIACLTGLTLPDRGSIRVDDVECRVTDRRRWRRATTALRRRAGYSGDKIGVPSTFTVGELLRWSARARDKKVDHKWLGYLVSQLEISPYIGRRLGGCSSGMMQKAALAASLVSRPELVLWDEPTSNLDARARERVAGLVGQMSQEGTAFVIASHIPTDFEGLVDWVGMMSGGRIVRLGKVSDLAPSLRQGFEAVASDPKELASKLISLGIALEVGVSGNNVRFTASKASLAVMASGEALARVTGCQVKRLTNVWPSVQDLYLDSLAGGKEHG